MKSFRNQTHSRTSIGLSGVKKLLVVGFAFPACSQFLFAQAAPSLGYAQNFAVVGGSAVTSTGLTVVTGGMGISPGTSIIGFPPGRMARGGTHINDATAVHAQKDLGTAYTALSGQPCGTTYSVPTNIGGSTLSPGVYCFASSAQVTGQLTLDAGGDPNAVWIFKVGSTLTSASSSTVKLINSAHQQNVFWQVGSSATLGTGTSFQGNVLALTSITLQTSATLYGRALARNGAVTMDTNAVSYCVCIEPYDTIVSRVVQTTTVAPAVNGVPGSVLGAALSPDGKSVWVSGYNGTSTPGFLSLVNIETYKAVKFVVVGAGPADISFTPSGGRAFVTNFYDSSVSVISLPKMKLSNTLDLSSIPVQFPSGVVYGSGRVMVTNQGTGNLIPEISNTTPPTLHGTISIAGQSGRPTIVPASATKYANTMLVPVFATGIDANAGHPTLAIVDVTNSKILHTLALSTSKAAPMAVVVSPDGNFAYVSLSDSNGGSGGVWVISLQSLKTKTVILTCDSANYGEAISSDGKYLLVAGFINNQVALIETATDTVRDIIGVGRQPNAIVLTGDNSEAFVTNQTDGTVKVIAFTPSL